MEVGITLNHKYKTMNAIAGFRLNTLTTIELIAKIDAQTDLMFKEQKAPTRHIPARPNEDYDLLIGELIARTMEFEKFANIVENHLEHIEKTGNTECLTDLRQKVLRFLSEPFGNRFDNNNENK